MELILHDVFIRVASRTHRKNIVSVGNAAEALRRVHRLFHVIGASVTAVAICTGDPPRLVNIMRKKGCFLGPKEIVTGKAIIDTMGRLR